MAAAGDLITSYDLLSIQSEGHLHQEAGAWVRDVGHHGVFGQLQRHRLHVQDVEAELARHVAPGSIQLRHMGVQIPVRLPLVRLVHLLWDVQGVVDEQRTLRHTVLQHRHQDCHHTAGFNRDSSLRRVHERHAIRHGVLKHVQRGQAEALVIDPAAQCCGAAHALLGWM